MRVGILEIIQLPVQGWAQAPYALFMARQYASLTPQAIATWCRRRGHEVHYATYHGLGDPGRKLPADLDVVFLSCFTQASPLAYALGRLYKRRGARTVIGGPHAKAFPRDCLRFFDHAVLECDETLVDDILAGRFDPGTAVTSPAPYEDVPTVEERMPEIRASTFLMGRPHVHTWIPMLASMGCPYTCDFCIDWKNPYRQLPLDRLAEDCRYLAEHHPGVYMSFHDPNFGVKFDQVMDVLESVPAPRRVRYLIEASLSVLRGPRLPRLRDTRCSFVAPGVESWFEYSNKSGDRSSRGHEKVDQVVTQFETLAEHVPYLQANFIFGLDTDQGDDPIALTKEFMSRTPFVWPTINVPIPFGGTPLHERYLATGRILRSLPFAFYWAPYLATTLANYDPVGYYRRMVDVHRHRTAPELLRRRLAGAPTRVIQAVHWVRTQSARVDTEGFERILGALQADDRLRAFHDGRSDRLPEFYDAEYARILGRWAELVPHRDRRPELEPLDAGPAVARATAG